MHIERETRMVRKHLVVLLVLLSGCAGRDELTAAQQQVADLKKASDALKADLAALRTEFDELKGEHALEQIMKDIDTEAFLNPGAEGYAVIQTDLGRMTVKIQNIEPYANGSRVKLMFGNLTSATVNGAKATIEWGSVTAKGMADNATAKQRKVTFNESLRAGAWTTVTVVLEGVPPTSLGFVRVKEFGHTGVSLLK
jgi:outer membrane murein-binding lipoprotein Lpp